MTNNQPNYKQIKVSIILLNWNNPYDTVECIESIKQISYPNYQIIVVDNNSTDDSIKELENIGNIQLIRNDSNLGFAGGNNVGIEYALKRSSDLILLLNNDTVVDRDFLSVLVGRAVGKKNVGIIGSKIYNYSEPAKIWSAGGGITKLTKRTFQYGENKSDEKKFNREMEVDFLSGCCMLIKREVFERIGLLDAEYFMYYEDVDFCLRAKKFCKVIYTPGAIIWHKVSATSNKSYRDYYRMRNYMMLLNKQFSIYGFCLRSFATIVFVERLMRMLVRKYIFRDKESLKNRIQCLISGFREGFRLE